MHGFTKFTVKDANFQMQCLPTTKAIKTLTRLTKIASGPIGNAVGALNAGSGSVMDKEINMEVIGEAVKCLGDRLEEQVVVDILNDLLSTVEIQTESGKFISVNLDLTFQGKIGLLFGVVTKALEVNYADFLGPILSAIKGLQVERVAGLQKSIS